MSGTTRSAETLAACMTPAGSGAIATLALRGPDAWTVIRKLFRPLAGADSLPSMPQPGECWLGWLGEGHEPTMADEVMVAIKRITPHPWVDLHCHGGTQVVRWLLEILEKQGLRVCSWQELELATIDDPARAIAEAALVEAPTVRTAGILLDQYHGAFARAVEAVVEVLRQGKLAEASRLLKELTRYGGVGRHLTEPWRVAIVGPPNVGKSSLVNALAGYRRSVVAPTPGTTRDVVSTRIAIDGWQVELSDTAGMRAGAESLEHEGIGRARQAAAEADLCLWVLDASSAPVWPDLPQDSLRLVVNKTDLPAAWDPGQASGAVRVSALTGAGLDDLLHGLSQWLVPDPPPAGAAVPFSSALCSRVEEAAGHCAAGEVTEARRCLEQLWRLPERYSG